VARFNHPIGRHYMTWQKPDFKVVEANMEVTMYVYRR
jgi:coenzyme PQQ precursor peptide PqqA